MIDKVLTIEEARDMLDMGEHEFRRRFHDEADPLSKMVCYHSPKVIRFYTSDILQYKKWLQSDENKRRVMVRPRVRRTA